MHSLIDDHSKYAYSEILPDEKGATCVAFLLRPAGAFTKAGITRIERLITDNHMSYKLSRDMREAVAALGARHLFIKPTAPGRTTRSNDSTAPSRPSRPTDNHSPATTNAQPLLHPGSSTTTLIDATVHSADCHRSVGYHLWPGTSRALCGRWPTSPRLIASSVLDKNVRVLIEPQDEDPDSPVAVCRELAYCHARRRSVGAAALSQ